MEYATFQKQVWRYYRSFGRHDLPWRQIMPGGAVDPYAVMVSELMLQQTQVPRVIPKYQAFLKAFPTLEDLAHASLADVLRLWSGLGYNRRAKFLWQAAGKIMHEHDGQVPATLKVLTALPGIGPNTAGAILAYAFNQPVVFIETNIRSVYIHHFFPASEQVHDAELVPLIEATLARETPREWYWALMDYGTHLKQTVGNTARTSRSYTRQSAFHGSRRKVRGQVLKALTGGKKTLAELAVMVQDKRLEAVLADLAREGFIEHEEHVYRLCS